MTENMKRLNYSTKILSKLKVKKKWRGKKPTNLTNNGANQKTLKTLIIKHKSNRKKTLIGIHRQ